MLWLAVQQLTLHLTFSSLSDIILRQNKYVQNSHYVNVFEPIFYIAKKISIIFKIQNLSIIYLFIRLK